LIDDNFWGGRFQTGYVSILTVLVHIGLIVRPVNLLTVDRNEEFIAIPKCQDAVPAFVFANTKSRRIARSIRGEYNAFFLFMPIHARPRINLDKNWCFLTVVELNLEHLRLQQCAFEFYQPLAGCGNGDNAMLQGIQMSPAVSWGLPREDEKGRSTVQADPPASQPVLKAA
jgi:hypothetical protein